MVEWLAGRACFCCSCLCVNTHAVTCAVDDLSTKDQVCLVKGVLAGDRPTGKKTGLYVDSSPRCRMRTCIDHSVLFC